MEGDELKRARPSTPPDEEDEGMGWCCFFRACINVYVTVRL